MNLRKYIRTLILENVKFAAFHGLGLNPSIMARDPKLKGCVSTWEDETDSTGCPLFPGEGPISAEEIKTGVNYLNDMKPITLMVYSRGAAVLGHCLSSPDLKHVPNKTIFIAAAWKRWGVVNRSVFDKIENKTIMHGELDAKVPLAHSLELANGQEVGILLGADHYVGKDFLKGKLIPLGKAIKKKYPTLFNDRGRVKGALKHMSWKQEQPDEYISGTGEDLPDWGLSGYANENQIIQQIEWVRNTIGKDINVEESKKSYSILKALYS